MYQNLPLTCSMKQYLPPGRRTLCTSLSTATGSRTEHSTSVDTTTSNEAAGAGIDSASPWISRTTSTPCFLSGAKAIESAYDLCVCIRRVADDTVAEHMTHAADRRQEVDNL